ncbi:NADPH-dependent FMN reductase [Stenotrophomonas sp. NLF4-10]|uniref:NADPH-dependent FMN reductase n=1 Tax=Stenotrophomonas sp. NLF4-10 TaxID=2918754 RepID=UPI001EFACFB4|nr:NADPH-dependent FMN reductase [Stenotrophomonas sp. NLF4-10]MCG8275274.1 NAD(P)H-dependent oxidoreductase [Stenotrophomonas sp. NLF4-10]
MKVLGLCGSLRSQSLSAALLRAAQSLSPTGVDFRIFDRQGQLPLFNPELEPNAPEPVLALWESVTASDAIVIASPEYAHGVTGTIKNTLDWLVGHIPFAYKPVAVLNPAYQSHHADEALKEILRTMCADLIQPACVRVPVIGSGVAPGDIATTAVFSSALSSSLQAIVAHVQQVQGLRREA